MPGIKSALELYYLNQTKEQESCLGEPLLSCASSEAAAAAVLNLQEMSILREVETGKLMLLLTAWQTKTAPRSVLRTAGMRRALTVAPLTTSYESSTRACSRHHVSRGDGLPASKVHRM